MLTLNVTYPDESASEARFRLTMIEAMDVYAPSWPDSRSLVDEQKERARRDEWRGF
jgi:hypothetical protein